MKMGIARRGAEDQSFTRDRGDPSLRLENGSGRDDACSRNPSRRVSFADGAHRDDQVACL